MGVAEIEYTWDYVSIPSKLSFFWGTLANTMVTNTLSPGKTKERTALFSLPPDSPSRIVSTLRDSRCHWNRDQKPERIPGMFNLKLQTMLHGCSDPKNEYFTYTYIYIYIYILHSYYWSISVSFLNITTKQDVQHAPQAKDVWNVHQVLQTTNSPATHTVFFPCRSNSYGTNALTKSSGIRQIWWTIHIKNAPARDLEQCGG